MNPAIENARVKSRAILDAQLCQNYYDLLSWASEPLKQRVHFLRSADGANLKELLGLWDPQQSRHRDLQETSSPTVEQIHQFLHQCTSGLSDSLSETTLPVYHRVIEAHLHHVLVPLGRFTPQEYLSVALVTEDTLDNQDADWKYHGLALSQEHRLVAEGWKLIPETTTATSSSPRLSPLQTHPPRPSLIYGRRPEQIYENDDDEDDDDDDYWQQYGKPEAASPSAIEPSSAALGFGATTSSLTVEQEVDAEEEEYWRKYTEYQEEQQQPSTLKDSEQHSEEGDGDLMDSAYETYSSKSPSSFGSIETRRILVATSIDNRAEHANNTIDRNCVVPNPLDDGLTCPVDPTTLTMLLEQLAGVATTVGQDNSRDCYYLDGDDDEDDNDIYQTTLRRTVGEFRPRKGNWSNNVVSACSRSVSLGTQSLSTSTSQKQELVLKYQQSEGYHEMNDCYHQENAPIATEAQQEEGSFSCQQSEPLLSPPTIMDDDPASCSSSVPNVIKDGIGMSPTLDKSHESLVCSKSTTATTATAATAATTTLESITPLDSPPQRSSPCVSESEFTSALTSDSENPESRSSDMIRILRALKALVSEASSFGLDQQDLLAMLEECF
ncbi:hypothetical protein EMPS_01271 [Entomortierella parvispora]|uniref:Uncharacterized protein n=1 Tax=Entomortierella parvispora TaxID=205924 RepID=A0A9P3H2J4_9FUNG|nr:hypothetical protein EMPS_01271 [Entomortierella parvispora]